MQNKSYKITYLKVYSKCVPWVSNIQINKLSNSGKTSAIEFSVFKPDAELKKSPGQAFFRRMANFIVLRSITKGKFYMLIAHFLMAHTEPSLWKPQGGEVGQDKHTLKKGKFYKYRGDPNTGIQIAEPFEQRTNPRQVSNCPLFDWLSTI